MQLLLPALFLRTGQKQPEHRRGAGAAVKLDGVFLQVDPVQRGAQILQGGQVHTHPIRTEGILAAQGGPIQGQVDGLVAAAKLFFQNLVGVCREHRVDILGDVPRLLDVAARAGTADIRRTAGRLGLRAGEFRVVQSVDRLQRDPLVGLGKHLFVEGRAFQRRDGLLLPALIAGRLKFVKRYRVQYPLFGFFAVHGLSSLSKMRCLCAGSQN